MVFDMHYHANQPLRHGRDVDGSMNCTLCTTGTKTTLSNCNCEISMDRDHGDQPLRKTGVSTTRGELQLRNRGTCR